MPRKTKIICTLGPAVDAQEMMEGLIRAGMNVGRYSEIARIMKNKDQELKLSKKQEKL